MNEKNEFHLENKTGEIDSWKGWISVGCAFASMFICFGITYSFGAFFDSMSAEFNTGRGATSAVFSITMFIIFTGGIVSGNVTDRFGPKPVLIFGGLFLGLGLYLTSLVNSIWVGYITYGLGVGIGVSCGYVPMLAVVGAWFEKRRAAAIGVAVTGIGFGTLLMAPLAADLINKYGWRQTYVILAILSIIVIVVCGFIIPRPPLLSNQEPKKNIGELVKTPVFQYMYFATFLSSLSLYFPFVFLIPYAKTQGINEMAAASLIGIIGMASVFGRLGFGVLGSKINCMHLFQITFIITAFSFIFWLLASKSFVMLVIFALLLGTGYGGFVALGPTLVAELFGLVGLGSILGTLYTAVGFGGLLGSPMGGYLIDTTGSYTIAIIAALAISSLAFLFLIPVERFMRSRIK
ncbi:MAG: MFS transporter [Proteobacteria bacterium]|nr:MFS transporter [Pseudomonadota bacterium]MBU1386641.1 MFS transporter [Pseudomonadota bacterium]MBU1543252.1 MFS transporter [Pseudomonadota bacterium]